MRRLLPPSRSDHDPLSGREWHHFKHGDLVTIDEEVYKFYRYDRKTNNVEIAELHTRLLYWYDADLFIHGADNMTETDNSALFYKAHTPNVIRTRRQNERYNFMERLAVRDGTDACRALTQMANQWWKGTVPTKFEGGPDE